MHFHCRAFSEILISGNQREERSLLRAWWEDSCVGPGGWAWRNDRGSSIIHAGGKRLRRTKLVSQSADKWRALSPLLMDDGSVLWRSFRLTNFRAQVQPQLLKGRILGYRRSREIDQNYKEVREEDTGGSLFLRQVRHVLRNFGVCGSNSELHCRLYFGFIEQHH